MKLKTGLELSARRPTWNACACALMALVASLLLVPAASAKPAPGLKEGRGGQAASGPKAGRGVYISPIQLMYEFLD
jgi:hypothetical protein